MVRSKCEWLLNTKSSTTVTVRIPDTEYHNIVQFPFRSRVSVQRSFRRTHLELQKNPVQHSWHDFHNNIHRIFYATAHYLLINCQSQMYSIIPFTSTHTNSSLPGLWSVRIQEMAATSVTSLKPLLYCRKASLIHSQMATILNADNWELHCWWLVNFANFTPM